MKTSKFTYSSAAAGLLSKLADSNRELIKRQQCQSSVFQVVISWSNTVKSHWLGQLLVKEIIVREEFGAESWLRMSGPPILG